MANIFLNTNEKENLAKWKYSVEDNSITTEYLKPVWQKLATFFPEAVTPNMITLSGLICSLYAFHLAYNYVDIYPKFISVTCVFFTLCYFFLDAIDGICARGGFVIYNTNIKRSNMSSPLGELFDHSADNLGSTFMMLTLCFCLGVSDIVTIWYFVQTAQLVFLDCHLKAFRDRVVRFGRFIGGPGEFILTYCAVILWSAFIGFDMFSNLLIPVNYATGLTSLELGRWTVTSIYYLVFTYEIYQSLSLVNNYATRNGLLLSLVARCTPSVLIYLGLLSSTLDLYTVICHGLIMSVLVGDVIVAKMASRELHPLVPIMIMLSLLDNFVCILVTATYYGITLTEISFYLRTALLGRHVNVFCNGVFDLCHTGHLEIFRRAASYGTRLLVGVHNDADTAYYKRTPTMNHKERCEQVSRSRYVDQVITNCPLILTREFIGKNNIHVVVYSEEYNTPQDEYYKVVRELGIGVILPRTDGISTTDIMRRIEKKYEENHEEKDKQEKDKKEKKLD